VLDRDHLYEPYPLTTAPIRHCLVYNTCKGNIKQELCNELIA